MADSITKINSEYDMISIMQDISKKYFSSDLSEERLGMFGHVTESMAHMFGASILDASIRANEYNIITAKQMNTLKYEAVKYGLSIENAKPSTLPVYMGIPIINIIGKPYEGGFGTEIITGSTKNNYKLVIEKSTVITIQSYTYMFEHDIEINAVWSEAANKYIYSVKYLTEGDVDTTSLTGDYTYPKETTSEPLVNKYIQSYSQNSSDYRDGVLIFKINLKQLYKKTEYNPIIKNDFISLSDIEFLYDNMLSHFNVYYKLNNSNIWSYIKAVPIYDKSTYDENIIRYDIDSKNKKIIFSITDFEPEYNSEFMFDIYTTVGETANGLQYKGDGNDISVSLNSFEERHSYIGMTLLVYPTGIYSYGGKDVLTFDEIKELLIRKQASLNGIDSEYDILNYIKDYDSENSYVVIKKRSDILERIYSVFSIPRDTNSDILSSSTLPFISEIDMNVVDGDQSTYTFVLKTASPMIVSGDYYKNIDSEIESNSAAINYYNEYNAALSSIYSDDTKINNFNKQKSLVNLNIDEKYTTTTGDVAYVFNELADIDNPITEYRTEDVSNRENALIKIYGSPYTIIYDKRHNLASFYKTSINSTIQASLIDEEISSDVMYVINRVNIERNSLIGENSYKFTVTVLANGDDTIAKKSYDTSMSDSSGFNKNTILDTIMLKGFIYDNSKQIQSFFNFDFVSYSDSVYTFEGYLTIDENINLTEYKTRGINTYPVDDYPDEPDTYVNTLDNISLFDFYFSIGVYTFKDIDLSKYNTDKNYLDYSMTKSINSRITPIFSAQSQNGENNIQMSSVTKGSNLYPMYSHKINNDTDDLNYYLVSAYDSTGYTIKLFTDMATNIKTSIAINDVNGKSYITFSEVPVFQYSKLTDSKYSERISNVIDSTNDILNNLSERITNNFSFDYKFFRTYGPGMYFSLVDVNGNSPTEIIDGETVKKEFTNLDISIEFRVIARSGITMTDNELINSIRKYVKEQIESLNNSETSDYSIYISNIITSLEIRFSEFIRAIEFVGINGENSQYRILKYDIPDAFVNNTFLTDETKDDILAYVPEYINMPLENIKITVTRTKY